LAHDSGLIIETIWGDPHNGDLRARRESWDRIGPGDDVFIRAIEKRTESGGTETRHRFRRKNEYGVVIRIDVDPEQVSSQDDRFVLKCGDGSYHEEKTIEDDLIRGDQFVDLHFSGLRLKKSYTLEVIPGAAAEAYTVFENVPYEELANLYAAEGTEFEPQDVEQETLSEEDDAEDEEPYPDEPDEE
jgi:hypothetical protein